MSKVTFKLAAGYTALRHALAGGREIKIDGAGSHTTDDPAVIAALDAHPATKRAAAAKKPAAKKKPAVKKPAAAASEEASA